jgi:polyhydroxyalkanoate synthase
MEWFCELWRAISGETFRGVAGAEGVQLLVGSLAAEIERRLREGIAACPSSLPGISAGPGQRGRRVRELLARRAEAQQRIGLLWNTIAWKAAENFASRVGTAAPNLEPHTIRKLYDIWIDCAEEAYGATARTEEYSRAQAELINTMAALAGEQGGQGPSTGAAASAGRRSASRRSTREPGCSLREAVWKRGKAVLYRYLPLPFTQPARTEPVLISYALVNRPYVLDLKPDRSLVRDLLAAGLEVYLIDWGYPDEADRKLGLNDYISQYLGGCVRHILKTHRTRALNLLGICQGGALSLCYCAQNPGQVANLILLATPVDFQIGDNLLSTWARYLDTELIARGGNLSGSSLTGLFMALSPFRLMHQKYVALMDQMPDANAMDLFARMEQWIFDSPDQAAVAISQFVRWFYQENRLVRGALTLGRREVDLKRIRQPVLNVYATRDHIVPPSASTALRRYVGSADYTEYSVDTGHVGLYVSAQARRCVRARISSWLRERSSGGRG